MKVTNILLAALMTFVQTTPLSTVSAPDMNASAATTQVEFVDLSAEHSEIATWAVGLYQEAGLELPAITFVYHGDDTDACEGWFGVHEVTEGRSVIGICTSRTTRQLENLFVHELAHAWCAHSLPEERRSDFQELRSCPVWRGDVPWHERGAEQAAEILMWGLVDRPTGVVTIDDHGCDDLEAGYRALTGDAPLHGYRDYC